MPDYIGNIAVPEIVASGVFPIVPDMGYGRAKEPLVAIHRFGSGNTKIEQRYLIGTGARRFMVRRARMKLADRTALKNFFETQYGPYGAFTYNVPSDDGASTTATTCRFANEPLSWDMIHDAVMSLPGVTLVEIPANSPTYPLNATQLRFPSGGLPAALLSQVQHIIPLIKIQPLKSGYPAIYLSNQRCTVGAQLYLPRLLKHDGIGQSMDGEADQARFTFGNADRVMRDLANDVNLERASIEFSLYHVGTGIKLDFWKGEIQDWNLDASPEFSVTAADGLYELTLPYPSRRTDRLCSKDFDAGASSGCPYTQQGALDLAHFPNASALTCDRGFDTPNGCLAHGMKRYFWGVYATPQGVRIRDNSTGTWGYGRSPITSVSLIAESIYDQVIPEVYTDVPLPVKGKIAAGRDESDFYIVLAAICEGPVTFDSGHTLDGQPNHGPGALGLRTCPGNDPAGATDLFSLGQVGNQVGGDWRKVFVGGNTYLDTFAAGLAFIEIRRSDAKGLQLTRPGDHELIAWVATGLQGWIWTAAGFRTLQTLTNPYWIVVNALLRAKGLRYASAAECEKHFDVDAAIAAANIASASVDKLVGGPGLEQQFIFRGTLMEQKPLKDWIAEILMNGLGFYTWSFGKLKLGIRINSSVVEAFTIGSILFGSLALTPVRASVNRMVANFADQEFEFALNNIPVQDIDHAKLIGNGVAPLWLTKTLNLSGSPSKSQAGRVATVRLREELGGINATEWTAARKLRYKTTALALNVDPGMVCSMTHEDMPGRHGTVNTIGTAVAWASGDKFDDQMVNKTVMIAGSEYLVESFVNDENIVLAATAGNQTGSAYKIITGEFRVQRWKLHDDYSIDVEGQTSTDSMYNLAVGPKPADVTAEAVPEEAVLDYAVPPAPVMVFTEDNFPHDGTIVLPKITFGSTDNVYGITSVIVVVYYSDELDPKYSTLTAQVTAETDTLPVNDGTKFTVNEPAAISNKGDAGGRTAETVLVTAIDANVLTVTRAWHGTAASIHGSSMRISALSGKVVQYPFRPGFFINNNAERDRWTDRIVLPAARVTSIHAAATNSFGEGDLAIFNLLEFDSDPGAYSTQNGLRTNHGGGALTVTQDGVLKDMTYAGPKIQIDEMRALRDVYATVRTAPAGEILEVLIFKNGVQNLALQIESGQTISQYIAGGGFLGEVWNAGDEITYQLRKFGGGTLVNAGSDLAINFRW